LTLDPRRADALYIAQHAAGMPMLKLQYTKGARWIEDLRRHGNQGD
jgi:hypothetical protein